MLKIARQSFCRENRTYCGSNFDTFGNMRFEDYSSQPWSDPDLWDGSFNWGIITFDNLAAASLTIFQVTS